MKLNERQLRALDAVKNGKNLFITGQAGTGKSKLIQNIIEFFEKSGKICGLTSLTGISAEAIKGCTIHRWAGVGTCELKGRDLVEMARKNRNALRNWRMSHALVIDEISMMSPDMLEKLDMIGREIRRMSLPFGGIQLIICGDMLQLPPVKTDAYCFESKVWDSFKFEIHYLTQNMRQNQAEFQAVLADIRMGILTPAGKELLQSRVGADVRQNGIEPTKLFPKRAKVDEINSMKLKELISEDNPIVKFKATDYFKTTYQVPKDRIPNYMAALNKSCQAKPLLELAVGAQVILLHNLDIEMGLCNGSRGVIIRFEELRPLVRFVNGIEMIIQHHDWEVKISDTLSVNRRQIPLQLGYAITTHKAQGMTLDCVEADLGMDNFAEGQFYTCLSRVRTLEGLSISALDFNALLFDQKAVAFYQALNGN